MAKINFQLLVILLVSCYNNDVVLDKEIKMKISTINVSKIESLNDILDKLNINSEFSFCGERGNREIFQLKNGLVIDLIPREPQPIIPSNIDNLLAENKSTAGKKSCESRDEYKKCHNEYRGVNIYSHGILMATKHISLN